jgi:hypothetical protein
MHPDMIKSTTGQAVYGQLANLFTLLAVSPRDEAELILATFVLTYFCSIKGGAADTESAIDRFCDDLRRLSETMTMDTEVQRAATDTKRFLHRG